MFATTAPLRRVLSDAFPARPFTLTLWDGSGVPATTPDGPTFTLRSPAALGHVLRSPGELGLGRAYVAGELDVDDMDAALEVVTGWDIPVLDTRTKARLGVAVARGAGIAKPPAIPSIELRQQGALHSLLRDKDAIAYHYDAGNAFFELFLDPKMVYSCAIFSRGATTLEEAQDTKLDLVATKLALRPGDRLLDVGCGWGAFAIHAARKYGAQVVGITLAKEQAALARERVRAAGLQDRIEIRLADYRELADEPFDAISSIGMVEHVGENQIDEYARVRRIYLRAARNGFQNGFTSIYQVRATKPGGVVRADAGDWRAQLPARGADRVRVSR